MAPCNLVPSTRRVLAIDMVSFLHTSRTSTASLSSARFIPDMVCISSIHFYIGRPLFLLPSPRASIIKIILFHTVCSHHMAKELHLLFCCPLSQRQNFSCLSDLHQYLLVCPLLCPRDPWHLFPEPHFAGINFLLHFSCLCPCLATIQYHRKDNCIYNSCFCLQTY